MKRIDLPGCYTEIKRKIIHLTCSVFPLAYNFYLTREQIVGICSIISILFLLAEFIRFRYQKGRQLFSLIFEPLLRENEKANHITGATYLFLSFTVTFLIFNKEIAIAATLILAISDSLAAVVGKLTDFGRFFSKSLSGSITFFVTAAYIIIFFVPILGGWALIPAAIVTIIEALPLRINDNILISLGSAIILSLMI